MTPTLTQRLLGFYLAPPRCPFCGQGPTWEGLCKLCQNRIPLTGLAFPCCTSCGRPMAQTTPLCHNCRSLPPPLCRNRCLGLYHGLLGQLIHRYKGEKNRQITTFFARSIERLYWSYYPGWLFVPVPPRAGKIKKQGWDQIDLIARVLRKRFQLPVNSVLVRKDRVRQKTLTHSQRLLHQQKFHTPRNKVKYILGQRCLLIDDLFTTGITLQRCGEQLLQAGAAQVQSLTIAVV